MSDYESYRRSKGKGKSSCTSCFQFCASSYLSLTNLIDLLLGVIFLAYGVYLYRQNADAQDVDTVDAGDDNTDNSMKLSENANLLKYTVILIFSLGVLLIFVSLFGLCGLVSKTWQCCLSCTSYMLLPVIFLEIILCAYMAYYQDNIVNFLEENMDTFTNLNQNDIDEFKAYYNYVLIGVGASCLLHIFRFCIGKKLRSSFIRSDEEEKQRLLDEKDEEDFRKQERREEISNKWDRKRQAVQNKYKQQDIEDGIGDNTIVAAVVN